VRKGKEGRNKKGINEEINRVRDSDRKDKKE
jgi:hypothetical protein